MMVIRKSKLILQNASISALLFYCHTIIDYHRISLLCASASFVQNV